MKPNLPLHCQCTSTIDYRLSDVELNMKITASVSPALSYICINQTLYATYLIISSKAGIMTDVQTAK